jgi:hypothetical protein
MRFRSEHPSLVLRAAGVVAAWLFLAGCPRGAAPGAADYLHVIVERLPQCDYGIGFEHPVRVDLMSQDTVLATSYHSGIYTGEASLAVALHVPRANPGRYRIRFGQCPSLADDPAASVACSPVDWVAETSAVLTPAGIESPQIVEYYRLDALCLDGRRAR